MISRTVNDRQRVNDEQGSLKTMSRINEGLKRIVSLSREVEIRAINARLLARQAGTASEGYRVAAAELGNYSRELGKLAGVMESAIFESVHLAAGMQKLKKQVQLLVATANVSTSERVRRCAADAGQRLEQVARQSDINCLSWCERVSRMDIAMLCPQHGAIYQGEDVMRFVNWLSELEIGSGIRADQSFHAKADAP